MQIAIIGAGITGLTAAYRLCRKGHQVTIFEKKAYAGGLAAGFRERDWQWSLEHFFHHFFVSDQAAKNLISELGLSSKLFYTRPKTSIFISKNASNIFQFDSPLSLLKFPHLSFPAKLRVGLVTAYLKSKGRLQRCLSNTPLGCTPIDTSERSAAEIARPLAASLSRNKGTTRDRMSKDRTISALGRCPPARWIRRKKVPFEKITANTWLKKYYGQKPYQILWQPLLEAKFGKEANRISMSWFWARIKKRSARLGYLEGGFQILINKLVEEIKNHGGEILLSHEVKRFDDTNHRNKFDRIIFTVPTSVFLKIISQDTPKAVHLRGGVAPAAHLGGERKKASSLPADASRQAMQAGEVEELASEIPRMLGALNLILILKEKFLTDGTYWLNINEPDFPFVAVVEHTNFVKPKYYGGNHILYVGGYYPQNHRYFKMSKEQILKEFLPYLKKINPKFNRISNSSLREIPSECEYQISSNLYAQPIIPINYSKMIPKMKTPIPKVYLANMQMVYPWDRGVNYAIELGKRVAEKIGVP